MCIHCTKKNQCKSKNATINKRHPSKTHLLVHHHHDLPVVGGHGGVRRPVIAAAPAPSRAEAAKVCAHL